MPEIFSEDKSQTNKPPQLKPVPSAPTANGSNLESQRMHILSAFAAHPQGLSFADQTSDEEIILFLRRAFITNQSWIATTIILFVLPALIVILLNAVKFNVFILPTHFPLLLFIFYYLLVIGYAFANFLTWFYNIGIVTGKRVLDISFTNITSINVAATGISDIKDVEYSQKSFSESFFNYGDVTIVIEDSPPR